MEITRYNTDSESTILKSYHSLQELVYLYMTESTYVIDWGKTSLSARAETL